MSRDDESFFSRWSRRKRTAEPDPSEALPAVEGEAAQADAGLPGAEGQGDTPEAAEPKTDAEILEELGLKDPDLLEPGDDFSAFMRSAVPEHLRRRALRRLWRSNPVLANLDGLNDYDGDFTGGSVAPGMLKTAYKVGVGIVREVAEAEPPASGELPASAPEPQSAADAAEAGTDAPGADTSGGADSAPEAQTQAAELRGTAPKAEDLPAGPTRRRMRFNFEG